MMLTMAGRLAFLASLPERAMRSVFALVGGGVHETAELVLPRLVRRSRLYEATAKNLLRVSIELIGGVEAPAGAADEYEPNATRLAVRKTAGNVVELGSIAAFGFSPLWLLAAGADVTHGSRVYLDAFVRELKVAGVLAEEAHLRTVDELLAALEGGTGTTARLIDIPPLEVAALKRSLADLRADASGLPAPKEMAALFDGLRTEAVRERSTLLEVSTGVGIAFFNSARHIGRQHVLDPYSEDLKPLRDEGFAAYCGSCRQAIRLGDRASLRSGARHPDRARDRQADARPMSDALLGLGSSDRNVRRHAEWLAGLPALEAEIASRWRLELGDELPGGPLASVRAARRADGTGAVLKLAGPWDRTTDEIACLRRWDGGPAPTLLEADEERSAILLERVTPGTRRDQCRPGLDCVASGGDPRAGRARARCPRCHCDPASRSGRARRACVGQRLAWARTAVQRLHEAAPAAVIVHGDFDERNLLRCARRGLCAIDPLPCTGDGTYDAASWVHANRRRGRRGRFDAMVAAGFDRDRLRDWCAVVAVHG